MSLFNIEDIGIDPVIFKQGFVPGCNLTICKGQCCDLGVYVDVRFTKKILEYENEIILSMTEYQPKDKNRWFEKEIIEDDDFPSGQAVGTEVYVSNTGRSQCVFKDKNNFCSLQVTAVKLGMHKWDLKPVYSILYPLVINRGILTYDDSHSQNLDYCGIHRKENFTQTVFEAMTEEIKFVFGNDGYDFLKEMSKEYLSIDNENLHSANLKT